jgi:hypothetical protein
LIGFIIAHFFWLVKGFLKIFSSKSGILKKTIVFEVLENIEKILVSEQKMRGKEKRTEREKALSHPLCGSNPLGRAFYKFMFTS